MTQEEFKSIHKDLRLAYQRDGFLNNKDAVDLWFRLLHDKDVAIVRKAIDSFVVKSKFPPTIADINGMCEEIVERENKCRSEMREIFDSAKGGYPGLGTKMEKDTMTYWNKLTAADTWEERIEKARNIETKIRHYVESAERKDMVERILTFTEFLKYLVEKGK